MAFVNKIGNMLKQSGIRHTNLELCASRTSLYQAIRSMSSSKLFVGGLSYGTDETSLREAFSQHGEVVEARIIMDRESGRSRGFGFVSYTSSEDATSAMNALDGQDLHGRQIRVNYATEKRRAGYGGGYGGGGFNYGGGDGSFGGAGDYASNNYGGGGGSYGGNYGGVGYGNSNYRSSQESNFSGHGGNNFGVGGYGQDSNYSGQGGSSIGSGGFSGGNSNELVNNGGEEQLGTNEGTESVNEDFTSVPEGSYGNNNDEPNDYANSRG